MEIKNSNIVTSSEKIHRAAKVYDILDKIPGISNLANLLILVQKFIFMAAAEEGEIQPIGSYIHFIESRDIWECLLLALPIPFFGNIFIAVCRSESAKQKTINPTTTTQKTINPTTTTTPLEPTKSPKEVTGLNSMQNVGNSCYISSSVWGLMNATPELLEEKREEFGIKLENGYEEQVKNEEGRYATVQRSSYQDQLRTYEGPLQEELRRYQEELVRYNNALNNYKKNNPLPQPPPTIKNPTTENNKKQSNEPPEKEKDCLDCIFDFILGAEINPAQTNKKPAIEDNREAQFLNAQDNQEFKEMKQRHEEMKKRHQIAGPRIALIKAQIAFFDLYDKLKDPQGGTVSATVVNNLRNAVRAIQLNTYNETKEKEWNFHKERLDQISEETKKKWEEKYDEGKTKCFGTNTQEDADEFSIILRQTILDLKKSLNVKTTRRNEDSKKQMESQLDKDQFNEKIIFTFNKKNVLRLNNVNEENVNNTKNTNKFDIKNTIKDLKNILVTLNDEKNNAIEKAKLNENLSQVEIRKILNQASKDFKAENPTRKPLKAFVAFCDKILVQQAETIVFPDSTEELVELEKQLKPYCCQKGLLGLFKDPNNKINNINRALQILLTELGLIDQENECQIISNKPITTKAILSEQISTSGEISLDNITYKETNTQQIEKDAPILNFQIARFNFVDGKLQKIKTPVEIPDFVDILNTEDKKVRYTLASIVTHDGPTGNSGHYYSYLFKDGKVYKYDDIKGVIEINKTTARTDYEANGYVVYYKLDTSGEVIQEEETVEKKEEIVNLNKKPPSDEIIIIKDEIIIQMDEFEEN